MKTNNIKNIFILLGVTVFTIVTGIVLALLQSLAWVNLIIYILLALGMLWVLKNLRNNYSKDSKPVAVFSFVMMGIFYITVLMVKRYIIIPNVCLVSYLYIMGYLAFNGFLTISKVKYNRQVVIVGIFIFVLSIFAGIMTLFGLSKII